MEAKAISSGDEGYDELHAIWKVNGKASQFDRQGAFGGALYYVLDRKEEEPTFYQVASEGPTVTNQETETPEIKEEGWHTVNKRGFRLSIKRDRRGGVSVRRVPGPNKL